MGGTAGMRLSYFQDIGEFKPRQENGSYMLIVRQKSALRLRSIKSL